MRPEQADERSNVVLVLDTSAIIRGYMRYVTDAVKYTTPDVMNELSNGSADADGHLPLMNEASIQVRVPGAVFLRRVDETIESVGEGSLSRTDRSLLALALELMGRGYNSVLVTDDYAIQNVAEKLGLAYKSYIEKGIRRRYEWRLICPGCLRQYSVSSTIEVCPVCGSTLKRRIVTSRKVGQHR
jgi:UPF0271 protein